MSIADDLSYKIGGAVPVWIGAVGLSGAYLIFEKTRKKASAAATTAAPSNPVASPLNTPTETMDPYAGIDPTTGQSYQSEYQQEQSWQASPVGQYLSADPTNSAYPVGITPGGLAAPVSNPQWAEIAQNYLISKGDTPTDVLRAIQNFVNGDPLSAQDQAFVNLAVSQLGSPPQPVSPNLGQSGEPTPPGQAGTPVGPTNAYPGWTSVPSYALFQAYRSAGKTIAYSVNGGPLTPFVVNGKQSGNAPAGSKWYVLN